ncbi:MAG: hypothetical protein WA057_01395 [Candidatus Magasanikiibacteriota bacterium]
MAIAKVQAIIGVISMLAVIAGMINIIVSIIIGIIGITKKDYTSFKKSLKILLIPVTLFVLTLIVYAITSVVMR